MTDIVTRGNTISFAFSFLDSAGENASITSATLQLEYPGRYDRETEQLTLTENSNGAWAVTWDSSKARKGWINYHASGIDGASQVLAESGRFKTDGNDASYQHDRLPGTNNIDYDYIDYVGSAHLRR